MNDYIQRLRELRTENGYTQEEVARLPGTSQTMYARYERGANELPIRHLVKRHVEVMTLIGAIVRGLLQLVLSAVFS